MHDELSPQGSPRVGRLDRRTKLILIACAFYVWCPIDALPDFLPGIGGLDDTVAFIVGVATAIKNVTRKPAGGA